MKAKLSVACVVSMLVASPAQEPATAAPQTPSKAPAPAIVVLLRRALPQLDAERVRRQWARRIGEQVHDQPRPKGSWLQARGDGIVGGRDGAEWTLEQKPPVELTDAALPGLDDEDRALLRKHESTFVIATAPAADAEAEVRAYRLLGSVAASVLTFNARGVGAAHHGTFELVDEDTAEQLTGENPLAALEPEVTTSLVAFLARERTWDEAALEKLVAAEFKADFAATGGAEAQSFAVVKENHALVKLGEHLAFLYLRPEEPPAAAELEAMDDLRMRAAMRDRKALLQAVMVGPPGDAAEAHRRRTVARLVAALWGDDCLALSWHCSRRLVLPDDTILARLRHEDPVRATLDDNVQPVVVVRDEAAMDKAIAQARATWAEAEAHLRSGGEVHAKFPFRTRKGETEHIWIKVESVADGVVRGAIGNDPLDVADLKFGSKVDCKLAELSDWMFERDGKRVGGYTIAVLQERARRGK